MDTYWQTETGGFVLTPIPSRDLKVKNYTRNEWRRCETTLETIGEDVKLHSKRVEKTNLDFLFGFFERIEWGIFLAFKETSRLEPSVILSSALVLLFFRHSDIT
jgi:hypothetical protein